MPSSQPHILMCPPDFYGIHYEINPWMDMTRQADHAVAVEQWNALHREILNAGANVSLLEPVDGLPDLVFTANAAMIFERRALVSRFRHRQRQGEEPYNRRWLSEHGFEIVDVPENFSFEGAGDALFCGDTLYAGYRMRSDAAGHQQIGRMLNVRVIPVELVDARYYHLDTCFCPLAVGEAIWYPPAFDEYGQRAIREHVAHAHRGETSGSGTIRLQRRGDRPQRDYQHRLRRVARGAGRARLPTDRHAARRIRESGRQCEMPHAAARRRRGGRMAMTTNQM